MVMGYFLIIERLFNIVGWVVMVIIGRSFIV